MLTRGCLRSSIKSKTSILMPDARQFNRLGCLAWRCLCELGEISCATCLMSRRLCLDLANLGANQTPPLTIRGSRPEGEASVGRCHRMADWQRWPDQRLLAQSSAKQTAPWRRRPRADPEDWRTRRPRQSGSESKSSAASERRPSLLAREVKIKTRRLKTPAPFKTPAPWPASPAAAPAPWRALPPAPRRRPRPARWRRRPAWCGRDGRSRC